MAEKVDLKRSISAYRARHGEFQVLDVPDQSYLAVDGSGDPNTSPAYTAAVEALFPVAYALKFASKERLGRDYVVPPLEGLWWADDLASFRTTSDKSSWQWSLLVLVPEWLDEPWVASAIDRVGAKRSRPARLDDVSLRRLSEGRCVQTLHVGSYENEAGTLARMHDQFIPAQGLRMTGVHHEIYLSDPRRVAPERLRTILRQPVVPIG